MSEITVLNEKEVDQKDEKFVLIEEPQEEIADPNAIDPRELEEAKKFGLLKEEKDENEHKGEPEADSKSDKEEEKKITFEDVDKDKNLLGKFNKNEQALYWKYKSDRRKRQEAEERAEEFKATLELEKVKEVAAKNKLEKVRALLRDESRELTVSEILAIVDDKPQEESPKEQPKVNTEEDKQKQRIEFMEEMGRSQYPDFEKLVSLANEMVTNTPKYQKMMGALFSDPNTEPQEIIEEVVELAKKHPKYKAKEASPQEKEKVEKAIRNSERRSSASLTAGGTREISESELTIEQAAKLTNEQWRKLSPTTKQRIERQLSES